MNTLGLLWRGRFLHYASVGCNISPAFSPYVYQPCLRRKFGLVRVGSESVLESEAIEQSGRASDIWAFYACMTMKSSRNADQCRPPAYGVVKAPLGNLPLLYTQN